MKAKKQQELIIVASERDSEIFFKEITKPKKPSENFKRALKEYMKLK